MTGRNSQGISTVVSKPGPKRQKGLIRSRSLSDLSRNEEFKSPFTRNLSEQFMPSSLSARAQIAVPDAPLSTPPFSARPPVRIEVSPASNSSQSLSSCLSTSPAPSDSTLPDEESLAKPITFFHSSSPVLSASMADDFKFSFNRRAPDRFIGSEILHRLQLDDTRARPAHSLDGQDNESGSASLKIANLTARKKLKLDTFVPSDLRLFRPISK